MKKSNKELGIETVVVLLLVGFVGWVVYVSFRDKWASTHQEKRAQVTVVQPYA